MLHAMGNTALSYELLTYVAMFTTTQVVCNVQWWLDC